jgi:hypothetical protein
LFWRISAAEGKPSARQSVDSSGPCRKLSFSRLGGHPRREAAVQVPLGRETIRLRKEPGMQAALCPL